MVVDGAGIECQRQRRCKNFGGSAWPALSFFVGPAEYKSVR